MPTKGRLAPTVSVNSLKSKIRDVTRLLEHSTNLPAGVKVEKERALAGYKQDLEHALQDRDRQKMISKYHKVRFFERQKATRQLKKLKRRLGDPESEDGPLANVKEALYHAEIDLNYTIFYPLDEKYLSLFPTSADYPSGNNNKTPNDDTLKAPTSSDRPEMWKVVEASMQEGSLEALREGKLRSKYNADYLSPFRATGNGHSQKMPERPKAKKGIIKNESSMNDSESDGGFFEP